MLRCPWFLGHGVPPLRACFRLRRLGLLSLSLKRTGFPFFNPAAAGDVERPNAEHVLTIDIRVQVLTLVRQGLTGDDYLYTCRRYF